IIVRPDGVVKVTDFGIARALAATSMTMTGKVLGTVHYIAPEQARGERATPASDTYALGVVAWECLEGRRPFAFDSPLAIATAHASDPLPPLGPHVPPPVRQLIESATAKEPGARPATAGEFGRRALALAAGADGGAVAGMRPPDAADTVALPLVTDRVTGERVAEPTRVLPAMPPPVRGAPSGRWRLVVVLALALAIVGVALFAGNKSGQQGPRTPTTSARSTSTAISLAAAAYRGRPYADVAKELRQLQLVPDRRPQADTAGADTVLDVGTGPFQPGDTVPVTVSAGPGSASPSTSGGNPGESGPANGAGKGAGHDKKGKD
ncbi:MAG: eukaryotic-like serine/threonine-protein kinase, partial [Frankiaceae bacterium]|nr:eukaryotic-like serine/threonine-protein kinase [Frankiaceae bacterium]